MKKQIKWTILFGRARRRVYFIFINTFHIMRLQEKEKVPGPDEVDAAIGERQELQKAAKIQTEILSTAHRMQMLLDA